MRLKRLFSTLAQLFRPDKQLVAIVGDDMRALGVITSGAGIAAFLVPVSDTASPMLLLSAGVIIWLGGLFMASLVVRQQPKQVKNNG